MAHYATAADVIFRTGVKPEDLGLVDDAALGAALETLLDEVTDLMDRRMRKSWLTEAPIPAGLNGIAADAASDTVRQILASRQSPVTRIDDYVVRTLGSVVLSRDILERLKTYSAGGGASSIQLGSGFIDDTELEDDELSGVLDGE